MNGIKRIRVYKILFNIKCYPFDSKNKKNLNGVKFGFDSHIIKVVSLFLRKNFVKRKNLYDHRY